MFGFPALSRPVRPLIRCPGGDVAAGVVQHEEAKVYGLPRLAGLAQLAVVPERLRIGGNAHDLLAMGPSAIELKTGLTGRLIGRDHARAAAALAEVGWISASARAEFAAARQISAMAGVPGRADIVASTLALRVSNDLAGGWPAGGPEGGFELTAQMPLVLSAAGPGRPGVGDRDG